MALPNYALERRRDIASQLGIEEQYLYQLLRGLKTASPALAMRLHTLDASAKLADLRPDDWHLIWPELAKTKRTKTAATAGA